jgi:mercuric ion transport protein
MKCGKQAWLMLGSLVSAVAVSLCCIAPLVALVFGIGSFSGAGWLATVQPYFSAAIAVFLAMAWYLALRRPEGSCSDDKICGLPGNSKRQRIVLGCVTMVALSAMIFPWFTRSRSTSGVRGAGAVNGSELRLSLPTIGCAPDAWLIESRLRKTIGVFSSRIDYEGKRGVVRYDQKRILPQDIIAVVNATGFKAEPITSNSNMPMYELENVPVSCGLLPDELRNVKKRSSRT